MTEIPDLALPTAVEREPGAAPVDPIVLDAMAFPEARAVPGAIYSSAHKAMVLPVPTPRAAIVVLALKPALANDYPELLELRDALLQDVRPTDYAVQLGLTVDAPMVRQSLLDDGHDWLDFGDGATQETDLGYAAAVLNKHHGAYLAWARGYGKTLGTAALIEANGYERVLVAAPNTAKFDTWVRELQKRSPHHRLIVMGNDPQKRAAAIGSALACQNARTPFILVVHHEALALIGATRDEWKAHSKRWMPKGWAATGLHFDLFAFDEAHRLANNTTQLQRAARSVPTENRLALSGSVYQNNWEEPFGTLQWLFPDRYRSKWNDWNNRYLDYVEGFGKVCVGILPGREQAMRDELGVFMLVREKESKAIHMTQAIDLSAAQRTAYNELRDTFVTQLEDGTAVVAQAGVVMLTRLRQMATGLELLTKDVADSSKLDAAMRIISDYEDFDDFFVACWYKASAYGLAHRLRDAGYQRVHVITGDVPQAHRTQYIAEARAAAAAREHTQPVILIGTIPTLGESINLQFLNHVIRIDRSWNPATNRQVVDRVDRTGQTRSVRLTDIVARDTVDELVVMPNLANKDAFRALILGRPT